MDALELSSRVCVLRLECMLYERGGFMSPKRTLVRHFDLSRITTQVHHDSIFITFANLDFKYRFGNRQDIE